MIDRLVERDWNIFVLMASRCSSATGRRCVARVRQPSIGHRPRFADFGVRVRWVDLGWGPIIWLSTALASGIAVPLISVLDVPYRSNLDAGGASLPTAPRSPPSPSPPSSFAPVVEEPIFRGAVIRGLLLARRTHRWRSGPGRAVRPRPLRARLRPDNFGLVIALGLVGIGSRHRLLPVRRIGPTIIAHAMFNSVAMMVVISTWY